MVAFTFNDSGKVTQSSAEALAEANEKTAILAYSHGKSNGKPCYAYIAVNPTKYKDFYDLSKAGAKLKLKNYGVVIAAGYGEPPATLVTKMREQYGFDEQYGNKLKNEVEKQQKQFASQKEEKRIGDIVAMLKKQQAGI